MDAREQRGLVIAALCKLEKSDNWWLVPSQTGRGVIYRVNFEKQICTCPDFQENGHSQKCKHLHAVEFTVKREHNADGTITDTRSVTFTEKKTYSQNWPAYNAAQASEKDRFQVLLCELCRGVQEPDRRAVGRKPHSLKDAIFASAFKVYSTVSSRRFSCDLNEAHKRGYLATSIPGLKVPTFLENPVLMPILKQLIGESAMPLRAVETKFAIDSSGFSTNKFERWFDHKYGVTKQQCAWVKAHIATGVRTNVVTAVRVIDSGDYPEFAPLVKETAERFEISEVSADKAYSGLSNFEAVAECGGTAFIDFKRNAKCLAGGLFEKMHHYFQYRKDEFMQHYHQRSNVESTFSAVKRKFGDHVRSKTDTAMVNEVLCKFLCHNICCLIQEQHELGIEAEFWKSADVQPVRMIRNEPS
jgi:transposase